MAESLSERVAALEDHVQRIQFLTAEVERLTAEVERLTAEVAGKVERSDPGYVNPDFTKDVK